MMEGIRGKVVIITGVARGLGKAFSLAFAREGAYVIGVDIDKNGLTKLRKESEEYGTPIWVFEVDVTKEEEVQKLVQNVHESYGRVDVLVNNAALIPPKKAFYEIVPEEFDRVLEVNVKGVWLCARAVFPYMAKQGKGKIINLASQVFFTGSQGLCHYVASKGAVVALTRALAAELGRYKICVNAVAPGFTVTEGASVLGDFSKYDTSQIPLGRIGVPEDVVGAVLFFASDLSDYITGQVLLVDGGRVKH
ncbi:MAG: glucose 1-dehydrogenase [candidate division WOR-3 bacterium]